MEIGQKIKQLRIQKGLTLEELASRSELTKGFLSQMERDLTSPSIATLNDILEALGTTLAEFFKEEKEEQARIRKEAERAEAKKKAEEEQAEKVRKAREALEKDSRK